MSKRILVVGAGISGLGAIELAIKNGFSVVLFNDYQLDVGLKRGLERVGVDVVEIFFEKAVLDGICLVVKSPGIRRDHKIIVEAIRRDIKVIGDIDFGFGYTDAKIIGITGTNGKTTTTCLLYHIMLESGVSVKMAGNVGKSFCSSVCGIDPEYYILEVSSFQIDDFVDVMFDAVVILNITPDHLDRYETMCKYVGAKLNILRFLKKECFLVFNSSDKIISEKIVNMTKQNKRLTRFDLQEGIDDAIAWKSNLVGMHNIENIAAATAVAKNIGLSSAQISCGLRSFVPVDHRLQYVRECDFIRYYNDSKATNLDSAKIALSSFSSPIIWIMGGVDKGNNYEEVSELVKKNVYAIITLTRDNKKIVDFFGNIIPVFAAKTMQEAVYIAQDIAWPEMVVLLSPACASFDLFKNYEHRGNEFINCVKSLQEIERFELC